MDNSDNIDEIIRAIENSGTTNFIELAKISKLDPAIDFQFLNMKHANFTDCDLGGFNFTGTILDHAIFTNAKIANAVFDDTQIKLENLKNASDYNDLAQSTHAIDAPNIPQM